MCVLMYACMQHASCYVCIQNLNATQKYKLLGGKKARLISTKNMLNIHIIIEYFLILIQTTNWCVKDCRVLMHLSDSEPCFLHFDTNLLRFTSDLLSAWTVCVHITIFKIFNIYRSDITPIYFKTTPKSHQYKFFLFFLDRKSRCLISGTK